MAGATNPGNIGHAWVKALWVDKQPPPGFERPEQYDPNHYDFIRARIADNPIYANDVNYRKTLEALPEQLRKAFLDGDWNVFAGQYFDLFEIGRHTARPEEIGMQAWWPRWISIDWGFQHPSAVYWHCAMPKGDIRYQISVKTEADPSLRSG
jgi:phage terminase large subunit